MKHGHFMTCCALILAGSLGLSGCSAGLPDAYSLSSRLPALVSDLDSDKDFTDGFAADLCVVTDENAYDPGFITSEAGALFDVNNRQTLYSKDAFETMYPASITKVMTALIAIKYGNLEDTVTVTEDAVISEPGATLCGIKPGDKLTLEQLLYGLMLPSGNDAAAAIAIHMDGSIEAFADQMNEEARKLGAVDSHFVNPHGLHSENHYTTAYDLYLIFNEAFKYPVFREIIESKSYTANYTSAAGDSVSKTWKCSNQFITGERDTPQGVTVLGGKTGTTKAAGYCLIIASKDDATDGNFISVVLKSDSRPHLYDNMTNIISKIVK